MGLETIALISIGLSAISGGVAAYSSYQQGQAAKDQADYNAAVERNNQAATAQQADYSLSRVREKYRRVRASQSAAASASGMLSGGSLNDLLQDTNFQEDLDGLSVLYKSKVDITGSEQRSILAKAEGKQAQIAGNYGAASSLLSAGADITAKLPTLKKP